MDPHAGETAEQRAAREEIERLKSREGQAREFRDALMGALNTVNLEISANGIQPRIDAVIEALTMLQAEFVAMEPERPMRRVRLAEIEHNLKRLVTLHVSVGKKPAKPMSTVVGHG